jgi:hypothetical protein
MEGFTTTSTLSEIIDKRPMNKKRKGRRSYKMPVKGYTRAVQRIIKVKG